MYKVPHIGRSPSFSFAELFIFSNGRNVALRKPVKNSRSVIWKDLFHDTFLVDGQTSLGQPIVPPPENPDLRGWHGDLQETADCNETVEIAFEHPHEIEEIRLYPVYHIGWPEGVAYGFPINFKVQIKEEELDWITVEDWSRNPFPSPGNNPVNIPLKERKARAIRFQALSLPQSIPSHYIFAMAEMEVYAGGTNIAPLGKITTTSLYDKHPHEWNLEALTDGYGTRGKIIPPLDWLEGLAQRGKLEAELAKLIEQRTQQQDRLARTLKFAVRVLVGALLLAGAVMIRNKRRRQKQLRELKNRIASDLHDEVGSNLASITILAAGAKEEVKSESPHERSLQRMIDIAKETSASMRDIVWMLHPDRKTNMSLTAKFQDIAGSLLADLDFSLDESEEISASRLSMDKLHHFILFYKEVLHNLAKHSNSSQIRIKLTAAGRKIRLDIMDNGQPPPSGDLPQGLKLRAQKMGGHLTYQTHTERNYLCLEIS
ncbi:histidine kinase [Pontiellaceae bacterium B12227]|nr:histidine kinase [Pontiellaceae bacterium B12227]